MNIRHLAARGTLKVIGMVAGFVVGAGLGGGLVIAMVPFAVLTRWEPAIDGVIGLYVVGGALVGAFFGLLAARWFWRERLGVRP
jgi:hypothetical protein